MTKTGLSDEKFEEMRKNLVWYLAPTMMYCRGDEGMNLKPHLVSMCRDLVDCFDAADADRIREKFYSNFKTLDSMLDYIQLEFIDKCNVYLNDNWGLEGEPTALDHYLEYVLYSSLIQRENIEALKGFDFKTHPFTTNLQTVLNLWKECPLAHTLFHIWLCTDDDEGIREDSMLAHLVRYFDYYEPEGYLSPSTLLSYVREGKKPDKEFITGVISTGDIFDINGVQYGYDVFSDMLFEVYESLSNLSFSFGNGRFVTLFYFYGGHLL